MAPVKKVAVIAAGTLLGLGSAIQLVPVERSNPPVAADIEVPEDVRSVLRASCYDCHSHETRWPWYSRVAPVSWLVARDVEEARGRLNFSLWGGYEAKRQQRLAEEIWEEVAKGEMPLPIYLLAHPDARLSPGDREVLRSWSAAAAGDS
ncbi:MAG: heme-binding domain-containing protein [Thermoanaerobaculales bacterium]|nr:heme-binding domain-containing protein [Thermoanaerobaculales bacterium]